MKQEILKKLDSLKGENKDSGVSKFFTEVKKSISDIKDPLVLMTVKNAGTIKEDLESDENKHTIRGKPIFIKESGLMFDTYYVYAWPGTGDWSLKKINAESFKSKFSEKNKIWPREEATPEMEQILKENHTEMDIVLINDRLSGCSKLLDGFFKIHNIPVSLKKEHNEILEKIKSFVLLKDEGESLEADINEFLKKYKEYIQSLADKFLAISRKKSRLAQRNYISDAESKEFSGLMQDEDGQFDYEKIKNNLGKIDEFIKNKEKIIEVEELAKQLIIPGGTEDVLDLPKTKAEAVIAFIKEEKQADTDALIGLLNAKIIWHNNEKRKGFIECWNKWSHLSNGGITANYEQLIHDHESDSNLIFGQLRVYLALIVPKEDIKKVDKVRVSVVESGAVTLMPPKSVEYKTVDLTPYLEKFRDFVPNRKFAYSGLTATKQTRDKKEEVDKIEKSHNSIEEFNKKLLEKKPISDVDLTNFYKNSIEMICYVRFFEGATQLSKLLGLSSGGVGGGASKTEEKYIGEIKSSAQEMKKIAGDMLIRSHSKPQKAYILMVKSKLQVVLSLTEERIKKYSIVNTIGSGNKKLKKLKEVNTIKGELEEVLKGIDDEKAISGKRGDVASIIGAHFSKFQEITGKAASSSNWGVWGGPTQAEQAYLELGDQLLKEVLAEIPLAGNRLTISGK
jgi:hypothetical protein